MLLVLTYEVSFPSHRGALKSSNPAGVSSPARVHSVLSINLPASHEAGLTMEVEIAYPKASDDISSLIKFNMDQFPSGSASCYN